MSTAPSISTRVLFVLCCATQLVAWSGCSRMMSPPGQRLFGQNGSSAPDPYDWDMPPADGEPSPYSASMQDKSMPAKSNLGDQNPIPQSRQATLQAQYAQSYQVPERVPPRLIPIESVEFPGDEAADVVTASATTEENTSTREALAIGFSDYTSELNATDKGVKQAILSRDPSAAVAEPSTPSLPAQQKIELTTGQPQTKHQTAQNQTAQTETAPPAKAPTSSTSKLGYDKITLSASKSEVANAFKPDEFQAARRATKPKAAEASPSDVKAPPVDIATTKKDQPKSILPTADTVANPSKLALDAKPATTSAPSSDSTNGGLKMALPGIAKTADPKPAKPVLSTAAQPRVNPTKNSNQSKPTVNAELMAAGIKVDKNAFEISIPDKKKTESLQPTAKAQSIKVESQLLKSVAQPVKPDAQLKANSELMPAKKGNDPLALTSKLPLSTPKLLTPPADAVCSNNSCEIPSPTKKPATDVCGTVPKLEGLTDPKSQVDKTNKFLTAEAERKLNQPSAMRAPINSQLQPSTPPTLTAKPADKTGNLSPPAPNLSPANSLPNHSATNAPASNPKSMNVSAKTTAEMSSSQPTFMPTAAAKPKVSLSELNLLDRNFSASTISEKKPVAPPQPISKPISNLAERIPSQFVPKTPQLATHIERKPEAPALQLVNSQFCTEIKGFGQVTPFLSTRFKSNQRTLVYCEVENYHSQMRATEKGNEYVTRFRGRYQIIDTKGNVVQSGQFPEIEDVTVRKRRDFYLYFPITLKNLQPANYGLNLAIEESTPNSTGSDSIRVAEQTLQFTVE